jgi:hypothetical protein
MSAFTESIVEDSALVWLEALGYAVLHGPAIAAYRVRIGTGAQFVAKVAG